MVFQKLSFLFFHNIAIETINIVKKLTLKFIESQQDIGAVQRSKNLHFRSEFMNPKTAWSNFINS
ncbi:hypothetical protein AGMMS49593_07350 [Endomicrobiia bacterium]|nr:hypothetical protein AGMMS49593_07350 [Endomicrobiia bacterium]